MPCRHGTYAYDDMCAAHAKEDDATPATSCQRHVRQYAKMSITHKCHASQLPFTPLLSLRMPACRHAAHASLRTPCATAPHVMPVDRRTHADLYRLPFFLPPSFIFTRVYRRRFNIVLLQIDIISPRAPPPEVNATPIFPRAALERRRRCLESER